MNSVQVSINVARIRKYSQTSPAEGGRTQPTAHVITAIYLFNDSLAFGARLDICLSLRPLLERFIIFHLVTGNSTVKMFVTFGAYTGGT
jgi:hypothetical protein